MVTSSFIYSDIHITETQSIMIGKEQFMFIIDSLRKKAGEYKNHPQCARFLQHFSFLFSSKCYIESTIWYSTYVKIEIRLSFLRKVLLRINNLLHMTIKDYRYGKVSKIYLLFMGKLKLLQNYIYSIVTQLIIFKHLIYF